MCVEYRLTAAGRELQQLIDIFEAEARGGHSAILDRMSSIQSFCFGGCKGA
jgi:hypothetical protein